MGITKRAPKSVLDHDIYNLIMAHSMTPSAMGQYKRGLAHVLHTPGHNISASPDLCLGSHDDCFHARPANLVNSG